MFDALKKLIRKDNTMDITSDWHFLIRLMYRLDKKSIDRLKIIKSLDLPDFNERLEKEIREFCEFINKAAELFGLTEMSFTEKEMKKMIDKTKSLLMKANEE